MVTLTALVCRYRALRFGCSCVMGLGPWEPSFLARVGTSPERFCFMTVRPFAK